MPASQPSQTGTFRVQPERHFSKRYLSYCTANDVMPSQMRAIDECTYEGRPMTGYIQWMDARWAEWCKAHERAEELPLSEEDNTAFDAFVALRAQELAQLKS